MDNVCAVESDKVEIFSASLESSLESSLETSRLSPIFADVVSERVLCCCEASVELTSPYTGKVVKVHHKALGVAHSWDHYTPDLRMKHDET